MSAIKLASTALVFLATVASAQPPQPGPPPVVSPEVSADRRITFRLAAPQAESVKVSGGDMPGNGPGTPMMKGENGVWEATLGPVPAGTYRYTFNVNGISVVDPRNPSASESNNNVWSMVVVPGSPFQDTRDVPHGAVAAVTYYSKALGKFRRMHVYTPPGYESGKNKDPVFYLLHGASDSDESWSTVGRAGFILDDLIADGHAKPMVVVMPHGHTGLVRHPEETAEVLRDFSEQIMPYVEKNYRVFTDRKNSAIAGLSMGGAQTMNIFAQHPDKFAYVGVFSPGGLGGYGPQRPDAPPPTLQPWEDAHKELLEGPSAKKGLRLFWFSIGKEDRLVPSTKATVEMFKKHGFAPEYKESEGGHTWLNWRDYLSEFVPLLFTDLKT